MYAYPNNPTIKPQNSVFPRDKQAGWRGFLFGEIMRICSVMGCNEKSRSRGYCNKHYKRYMKYGNPIFIKCTPTRYKHGYSHTKEYNTWRKMIDRCLNSNNNNFKYYGIRGISVCDRWLRSFSNFYEDMGKKPFPKAQIDRIDNDGNYELSNCRWTTNKINTRNSRWPKLTMELAEKIRREYKPRIITQMALSIKYNVSRGAICDVVIGRTWI